MRMWGLSCRPAKVRKTFTPSSLVVMMRPRASRMPASSSVAFRLASPRTTRDAGSETAVSRGWVGSPTPILATVSSAALPTFSAEASPTGVSVSAVSLATTLVMPAGPGFCCTDRAHTSMGRICSKSLSTST